MLKKIITGIMTIGLILLLSCTDDENSVIPQNDQWRLTKCESYDSNMVKTGLETYTYNSDNLIIEMTDWSSGEHSRNSKSVLTYDSKKRLVKVDDYDNNFLSYQVLNIWNTNNQMISCIRKTNLDNNYADSSLYQYSYDSRGTFYKFVCKTKSLSNSNMDSTVTSCNYVYNQTGKLDSVLADNKRYESGIAPSYSRKFRKIKLNYSGNNFISADYCDTSFYNRSQPERIFDVKYNSSGKIIQIISQFHFLPNLDTTSYEYDAQNNIVLEKRGTNRSEFFYDEHKNKIEAKHYRKNSAGFIRLYLTVKYSYENKPNGQVRNIYPENAVLEQATNSEYFVPEFNLLMYSEFSKRNSGNIISSYAKKFQ